MPRTPEVCPTAFCPLSQLSNTVSSSLPIPPSASHQLPPASHQLPPASNRLSPAFRLLPSAVCLLLLLVTHHSSLITVRAQSATATLSGSVVDPSGAVIPGVNVAVINLSQGFQRTTTTNSDGIFVVPLLPPANYTVKAEHQGFTTAEVRDVVLNVNDQIRLNIQLKVGQVAETVEVREGADTFREDPAVATTIDRQFVANLPLNGRSFQSLITLTPGTVLIASSSSEMGQFSVNGQRADSNYVTVDGVSANVGATYSTGSAYNQTTAGAIAGFSALGSTSNLVSVDALQEFKVLTSTYAPEFGRTPGAQISIVTRSGTNNIHASLFEYIRNDALDANDWFANSRGRGKAALRQNIFGGVIGGPILFPRFGEGGRQPWYNGRDKTFFFFSYEGQRLRLPKFRISDVPSLSARQDPSTSAAIRQLLSSYPLPTGPEKANRFAEHASGYSDPSSLDATSIRIDHAVSQKHMLFGRYNYSPSEGVLRGSTGNFTLNTLNSVVNKTQTLTLGVTSVLSSTIGNEFRVNWSKVRPANAFALDGFGGAIVPSESFLIPSAFASPTSFGQVNLTGGIGTQLRTGEQADNLQQQINIADNVSVASGSHQFKFGIDYRRLLPETGAAGYTAQINFAGVTGALTGRTSSAVIGNLGGRQFLLYENFSVYGQDSWKAGRRLTLTYGFRWELNPPPSERNGNHPAVVSGLDNPPTMTLAPFGTRLYKTTYNNFAPRVGAAYQLSQARGKETILRGGVGVFYDLGNQTAGAAFGSVFPFVANRPITPAPFFPLTAEQAASTPVSRDLPTQSQIIAFDPDLELPRVYQWNFAVEQSLGGNQTLSASYVGALGRRLLRQQDLRGAALSNPNFVIVTVTRNTASSDYHALQLQFQRRLSRGLQALAFYTWSHSLDIASRDSATNESFNVAGGDPGADRGPSNFDLRHSFRLAVTYKLSAPSSGAIGKAILRDWSVDASYQAQSALPVNIFYTSSSATFGVISARPDLIQGVPLYLNDPTFAGGRRINRAAFSIPTIARQGSLGRNSLRGFPLTQLDFALCRQFSLSERTKFSLRADFFNLLNHPNFAAPDSLLPSNTFGQSTAMYATGLGLGGISGGLNPLYQVGGPRSIQFSLRFQY
jgi:hypothetical protein